DRLLQSAGGQEEVMCDASGRIIRRPGDRPLRKAKNGHDIYLTIDSWIQNIARQALAHQVNKHEPESAWALVLDARTSAVLAMVNWPEFNPSNPAQTVAAARRNRIITDAYEFGSIMKPITAAIALDKQIITPSSEFDCHRGSWRVGSRTVHDVHSYENLTVRQIIIHSSNIGAAQIGLKLGSSKFHTGLRRFGFGSPLGIHLPGEVSGIIRPVKRWNKHSLISVSFGQEIALTPLSVACAYVALANDGVLLRPHIVRKIVKTDNNQCVYEFQDREVIRQAVSRRAAWQVLEILEHVVSEGTGRRVKLDDYKVAGKTGTASLLRKDGRGYSKDRYLASFIGLAPAKSPRLVVLVSLQAPSKGSHYGGTVAGPAVREILRQTLRYLEIPPKPSSTIAEASE
ncbi:MAG: penicillin-binding protein 2, partial [Planctomycetes bacterium]|nr:penicillin-binding protein 2 [Planctomycetota bacterium]